MPLFVGLKEWITYSKAYFILNFMKNKKYNFSLRFSTKITEIMIRESQVSALLYDSIARNR